MPIAIATLVLLLAGSDVISARDPGRLHPWGRWLPGSWVQMEVRGGAEGGDILVERNQLVRVGEQGYVLQSTLKVEGSDLTKEHERRWALGGWAHLSPQARQSGEDTLKFNGKAYACQIWETEWREAGKAHRERAWISAEIEVPLRAEVTEADSTVVLVLAALDEHVEVAGRKQRCFRYEGTGKTGGKAVQTGQWLSPDVPGGVVMVRSLFGTGEDQVSVERRVTSFRGTPAGR